MTFVQEIEDFLLELRDSYGFIIAVDRLQSCLTCAEDIANYHELFYRMQSLICSSQEQIEVYRSLFAQRFFNILPTPSEDPKKKESKKKKAREITPEKKKVRLEIDIKELDFEIQKRTQQIEEQQKAIKEISSQQDRNSAEQQNLKQQICDLSQKMNSMVNELILNSGNSKLNTLCDQVRNQASNLNQDKCDMILKRFEEILRSANYKEDLDDLTSKCMKHASVARSQKAMQEFKDWLTLVGILKDFQKQISKAISSADKKNLAELSSQHTKLSRDFEDLLSAENRLKSDVKCLNSSIKTTEENVRTKRASLKKATAELRELEHKIATQQSKKVVTKEKAVTHRDLFVGGINSVQTTQEIAELLETNLRKMNNEEKQKILSFIRSNTRTFRQTMKRKSSTFHPRQIDIKASVQAAQKTNGEPIILKYKRPKKSHAKVMILTDISGSCRSASTLALYFMALMSEVFPGGCKKFCFVNSLVPVDKYFRNCSADEGVGNVLSCVPTRGIYSDYGNTIHMFREEYAGSFHKDTTVIILGDARNNSYESRAVDLKYIADRCHRVFWLNTDDVINWNCGDSIIGQYEKAGADVHHVATAGDLLNFLTEMG